MIIGTLQPSGEHPAVKWSRLLACPLLLTLIIAPWGHDALAWSREGHMVTGAIAYARLRAEDPEALAAVLTALRDHPHFSDLLQAPREWGLDAEDHDLAVFMNAARWADDIRSDRFEGYNESRWHYVNYHYAGEELTPPGAPGDDGFLLWALNENQHRLRTESGHDRAVALHDNVARMRVSVKHPVGEDHPAVRFDNAFGQISPVDSHFGERIQIGHLGAGDECRRENPR